MEKRNNSKDAAGGIFIPKENDTVTIGQFQPISLLNVEGKIFSVVARRLVFYLKANSLMDISMQKAGISVYFWMSGTQQYDLTSNSGNKVRRQRPPCSVFGSCKSLWIGATQSIVESIQLLSVPY